MKKTTEKSLLIPAVRAGARRGVDLVSGIKAQGGLGSDRAKIGPPAIEIGDRIRTARLAAGFTQRKLAGLIGCSQGDLSDIERGQGRDGPSYRLLRSIAEALEIELPINPDLSEPVVIEADADEDIQLSGADFMTFNAVFTQGEWDSLKDHCWPKIKAKLLPANLNRCVMVTLGPKAHIKRMVADTTVVVALVRGAGQVKMHGKAQKWEWPDFGCKVLEQGGSMVIDAAADQTLSMMVLPAHLMTHDPEGKRQYERVGHLR